MATVAALHSGTVVDADWSGDTLDVTISVGDISNCILEWAGGNDANDVDDSDAVQTLGYLVNSTTLRFRNGDNAGDIDWRILEFDAGEITSQHGEEAYDSTSKTVTITTVGDIDDAWCRLMGIFDAASNGYSGNFHGRLEFTNATTLTFVSAGNTSDNFAWQVVKYDTAADIVCQHGTITLSSVTNNTATINAVVLANTLCFINGVHLSGNPSDNDDVTAYGDFSSTTLVRVTKSASGGSPIYAFSIAELKDGENVQTGSMSTFTAGSETATLSPAVVLAQSLVMSTFACDALAMGSSAAALERRIRAECRLKFNSTTEIQADRLQNTAGLTFQWQTCEWPVAGGDISLTADPGALILTGASAALAQALASTPGALILTGAAADLTQQAILQADPGALVLTGAAANLAQALSAAPGTLLLTGSEATLSVSRLLQADPGVLQLTGADAALAIGLVSAPGALLFTGAEATLSVSRLLQADPGALLFTGAEADLIDSTPAALVVRRGGVRFLLEPDPEIREQKVIELKALITPRITPKPASREPQEPQTHLLSMVAGATARMTPAQQRRTDRLLQQTGISLEELLIILEIS